MAESLIAVRPIIRRYSHREFGDMIANRSRTKKPRNEDRSPGAALHFGIRGLVTFSTHFKAKSKRSYNGSVLVRPSRNNYFLATAGNRPRQHHAFQGKNNMNRSPRSRWTPAICSIICPAIAFLFTTHAMAVGVGDIAVISFASDTPDALAFVVLREIPAATVIRFTDSGWQAGGGFRANEGGIQYTAPANLTPGTVVSRTSPFTSSGWAANDSGLGTGGFAMSSSGDQILTFLGNAASPTFLHAVHFDSTGYGDATSSNTTALPTGLTEGTSAIDLPEADNGYYNGATTGTATDLLAAIGNPGNWTTSDSPISPPAWSFTILGEGPQVQSVTLPDSMFTVSEMTTATVTLTTAPDPGSPVTVQLTSGALTSPQNLMISNPDISGIANVTLANEGIWTVTATATTGGVGSADSAEFTVGTPVISPIANAGSDRSVELSAAVVTITLDDASGDDPDGLDGAIYEWTPITTTGLVSWQNRSGPLTATTDPATAQVTFDAVGAYVLTLTVTDSNGLIASDTTTISVNNPAADDQYDAPAGYYASATGQGVTLQTQLSQIITTGHVQQQFGDFQTTAATYDADPDVAGNILLIYNRASVPGLWDSGSTWNREHIWPQSLQPGSASNSSTGNLGDPHALRPADPGINGDRGNLPFGTFDATGTHGSLGAFYFPGDVDKGDVARSQFYSATRYMSTLTLVSGIPSGNTMGDVDSLVRWHYTDAPDAFERRRNHLIFLDQGNRIPYVDRPEFVWSVFGDGANDSRLFVSPIEPADGVSSIGLAFTQIIVDGPLPASTSVTLSKTGADPTYYAVTVLGDGSCDVTGRFNAFDFGPQQRSLTIGVAALTDTPGVLGGAVVIDNLDISSEGSGQGSDDGDDVIDVSLTVLDHADASFASNVDSNALTIDFGSIPQAAGIQSAVYKLYNLASTTGFTADLDVLLVTPTGDDTVLTTDAAPLSALAAGANVMFDAEFDPTSSGPGVFAATYTFDVADENLPGSTMGTPLTLTLTGTVTPAIFPFNDDGDADVDTLDGANFINCTTGPNGGWLNLSCANHDYDNDNDVDLKDTAALQQAFTGPLP